MEVKLLPLRPPQYFGITMPWRTQGFRKKVMPQAGAIKRTSDDLSPFFLTVEENHYVMNFTTRWDQWQGKNYYAIANGIGC